MPYYEYADPDTGEKIEILQGINDIHEYRDYLNRKWDRVYSTNLAFTLKVDPFNSNQFIEKTKGAGTVGDLMERSAELSAMRAEKRDGVDPVKASREVEYSKQRRGRSAPKSLKDAVVSLG